MEHGVVEQLVDPTSNLGVSQQHEDVRSGVPCAEHIAAIDNVVERTLARDWFALSGCNMDEADALCNGFLNAYNGCFRPTHNSHQNLPSQFLLRYNFCMIKIRFQRYVLSIKYQPISKSVPRLHRCVTSMLLSDGWKAILSR